MTDQAIIAIMQDSSGQPVKAGYGVVHCPLLECSPYLILGCHHLWRFLFEIVLSPVCSCFHGLGKECGSQRM